MTLCEKGKLKGMCSQFCIWAILLFFYTVGLSFAPASAQTAPSDVAPAVTGGEQTYKVRPGDTLTTFANYFGVTVKALRSANNLTTDKLKVGQMLKIPAKAFAPASQGDVFADVAARDTQKDATFDEISASAARGEPNAQIELARRFGKAEKYVESYKWINLVLAQAKPADFVRLSGISMMDRPFAMINGVTLGNGESFAVKTPIGRIKITCVAVHSNGVRVLVEGENEERTLRLSGFAGKNSNVFLYALKLRSSLDAFLTTEQIEEAQKQARAFKPRQAPKSGVPFSKEAIIDSSPEACGTGFFITEDGFFITNEHVVKDAAEIRLIISGSVIAAKVVKIDTDNDLALLKAEGKFSVVPLVKSRMVRLGSIVATLGFPNPFLQGFAPKLTKGEISALSGVKDDVRYFQISVPVQPGNSGGALIDERGNVNGVVSAKLSWRAALATTGQMSENVNYAVKSDVLFNFLESSPEVSTKLKQPNIRECRFEDAVKSAEQATAIVLIY